MFRSALRSQHLRERAGLRMRERKQRTVIGIQLHILSNGNYIKVPSNERFVLEIGGWPRQKNRCEYFVSPLLGPRFFFK